MYTVQVYTVLSRGPQLSTAQMYIQSFHLVPPRPPIVGLAAGGVLAVAGVERVVPGPGGRRLAIGAEGLQVSGENLVVLGLRSRAKYGVPITLTGQLEY